MKKYILLFVISFTFLYSNDLFYNSSSLQGYSGIINIPTAEVLEKSKVEFAYSNQVDAQRVIDHKEDYIAKHFFINFGFFSNLEITGRLADIEYKDPPGEFKFLDRDISASIKYQIPYYHKYLPKIAFGMQDIAGTANRYNAKYFVATKEFDMIRATLGYGFDSLRLNGLFGGVEFLPVKWFNLMFENDTQTNHVGLRVNTLSDFLNFAQFSFLIKTDLKDEKPKPNISVNMKIDLNKKYNLKNKLVGYHVARDVRLYTPTLLKNRLIDIGFENIDIADDNRSIYVAYENSVFDHNELDALAAVLGLFLDMNISYPNFEIVIKRANLKVIKIYGSLDLYKQFIKTKSIKDRLKFKNSLKINKNFTKKNLLIKDANSNYLKTKVELGFGLKTFIGTEIGLFDYLLSSRPYVYWTLYKGIHFGILSDLPLINSDEFDINRGAFRIYRDGNQILSAMISKSDIYGNVINILSGGFYDNHVGGFENILFNFKNHTARLKLGYLKHKDIDSIKNIAIATYRYYEPNYDTYFELSGGKFYNQDNGFNIELKRFFKDTLLKFFYQKTTTQYIGVGVEIPLTPRKVPNGLIQIKGQNDFYHQVRSVIRSPDGENNINIYDSIDPKLRFNIENRFLNRDRLYPSYIKNHILRLKESYFLY